MQTTCTFNFISPEVLPSEYQPYVKLLKNGTSMHTANILAAYARPLYGELWIIFSRLDIDVYREFNRLILNIDEDIMPVLLGLEDIEESSIPEDAIPLEVL